MALALCYSIAEYAAPVWARSTYAYILDPELNKACRAITGCLKPMNVLEWNEPNRWNERLIPCLVTSQQEAASMFSPHESFICLQNNIPV